MIEDEHFVPINGLDLTPYIQSQDLGAVQHLIRYTWAVEVIASLPAPKYILDVACGAGYGSFLFAKKFPQTLVMGADYDPKAIEYARLNYMLPNLVYSNGDVTRWEKTIGNTMFDCIVSFDTIEHVPHREIMLENLVRHLSPQGVLLLSTPCGGLVNELQPAWQAHRIEYSTASLYDFLSRYFRTILRPDDGTLPNLDVFDRLQGTGIDYLLRLNPVVCQDAIRIVNPYREAAAGIPPTARTESPSIASVSPDSITVQASALTSWSYEERSHIENSFARSPALDQNDASPVASSPAKHTQGWNTFSHLVDRAKTIAHEQGMRSVIPAAIHHIMWRIARRQKQ